MKHSVVRDCFVKDKVQSSAHLYFGLQNNVCIACISEFKNATELVRC